MLDTIRDVFDGSDLVAFAALTLAGWSLLWQVRAHQAQRRREREAENTANVVVAPEAIEGKATYRLVIRNLGPARAERIQIGEPVSLQGKSQPTFINMHNIFPIPVLGPTESVSLHFYVTWGSGHAFTLDVSWTDPRGRHTDTKTVTAA